MAEQNQGQGGNLLELQTEQVELEFARLIRVFSEKGWPITPVIKGRQAAIRALRAYHKQDGEEDGAA